MKLNEHIPFMRLAVLLCVLFCTCSAFAWTNSNGSTNYSWTAQALAEMTDEVVMTMGYVLGVVYAVASLTAIYNATVIYIKMNTGEGGFTKSVLMLVGAVLFLIGATMVLPSFFGYHAYSDPDAGNPWGYTY